jgi:hypothetical protein
MCWAAWLGFAASAFAISEPPVPIWPSDGKIPDSLKNQYVFLTPDLGTMVIVFPPEQEGSKRKILRLTIHNRICPIVNVDISTRSGSFVYNYSVLNSKTSKDDIATVAVVIPRVEPNQLGAETGTIGVSHGDMLRIGLTGAPEGWLVRWFCPNDRPLAPGASTRFVIESADRPGFTTTAATRYSPVEISSEWPEEIIQQASLVAHPYWVDRHVITLGPRYAPEYPAGKIAADYLSGMGNLTSDGRLDPNSPFVQ